MKIEKEKWSAMDKAQKKQYFLDYYFFQVCVIAVIAFIVCFLIWHFTKPRSETVLYTAVVDESLEETKKEKCITDMCKILGADGKKKQVFIDDSFYIKDGALDKIQVYLHSSQIDVLILDEKIFREYAGYGYFQDLNKLLDNNRTEKYKDNFVYAAGYKDTDEISFEDHETGQGTEKAYGISIKDSSCFNEMSEYIEKPVFAVAVDAPNQENALKFLDYLMSGQEGVK